MHYPALMLWQDGKLQELTFPRVKSAILAYLDRHMELARGINRPLAWKAEEQDIPEMSFQEASRILRSLYPENNVLII